MSRDKKYPRTIESKNSYLRIRAPEHLDVALEGLIRKVLKEQPKMDDIYAFAADYFDMLLKLREKSGIKKLSVQDICPHHNEEDAKEMIKLASTFTRRKKEPRATSRTYRAVSLKHGDHRHEGKGPKIKDEELLAPKNGEKFTTLLPIVNEHPEFEEAKPVETLVKLEKAESEEKESEIDFMVRSTSQDTSEKVIEAREVILEEDGEEEENTEESGIATVGDISEIRDKIKMVENEIKSLEKRESEMGEEASAAVETAEEVKSGVEDVGAAEATTPSNEVSEDATPSAENEITIEEVTPVVEGKREEEQEVGNKTTSETIVETIVEQEYEGEGDIAVQKTKEVQELDVKTGEVEGKKNIATGTEEMQDSEVEQTEEPSTVEEKVPEESLNDEAATRETEESEPGALGEQMHESDDAKETVEEKTDDGVVHEADMHHVEGGTSNIIEAAEESAQTEASTGDEETKADRSNAAEETVNTDTKGNFCETEGTGVVNPVDSTVSERRSVDPAEARETELMGGDEAKDERAENEEFLKLEKQSEDVQNNEPANESGDADKTAEDGMIVITVPENVEGESKQSEDVAEAAIAVAGGLEAAAAVLQHSKTELTDSESSKEELHLENEPVKNLQEVQKFLDRERQLYDKELTTAYDKEMKEEPIKAETLEVIGEVTASAVARKKLPENVEPVEKAQSGPSDAEAEGDDREREESTTSGEMEFEISPIKYPGQTTAEMGPDVLAVEEKTDARPEPQIVLELNRSESEDKTAAEAPETEPMKVFLSVPATVEQEYPAQNPIKEVFQDVSTRSKRSIDEEPEVISECANVGNDLIQTEEVQKVELIEGEEDILQVHLTTTIETVQENRDSLLLQMTSKIDPTFEVSMETKVESPVLDEKMRLVRAAVVIQNGFRRFRKRKLSDEALDVSTDELDSSETKLDLSTQTFLKDTSSKETESSFSSSATKINSFKGRNFGRSATRILLETHSLDPVRKITPLKTRSLSSVRYGVADFEVWNQLVKELEEAATKIQSNYRGYKTRKKLQRGNAIQSTTTTTSEDSTTIAEISHRHTGEFHDSIILPLSPE